MRNLLIKNCKLCNKDMIQTYYESKKSFNERTYCSYSCKNKDIPSKYWIGKTLSGNRKIGWKHSIEVNKEKSKRQLGHKVSNETKLEISYSQKNKQRKTRGDAHWNWKGGITPTNVKIRHSIEYKNWRTEVFKRDNFTCVECCSRGVTLNADHIKPFAYYPELRLVVGNGRTLCVPCHKKTKTFGARARTLEITKS